ncbi:MAG: hypothetical protein GXP40_09350 [Chloroflexi bacterium]|nr:hypothetical protein [Chloroflexota bacterium]
MEFQRTDNLPPPPGVINSLKSGFDAVANHITAIILPVVLDLFLWLGPHLRLEQFLQPLIAQLNIFAAKNTFSPADVQVAQEFWTRFSHEFNLMSLLRTFPIGVTSLISQILPGKTPLGEPLTLQIASAFGLVGWISLLTIIGWIFGGLYFSWVSGIISQSEEGRLARTGKAVIQTILLSLIWIGLLFVLGMPTITVFLMFFIISPVLAQATLLFAMLFAMWLIVPLFFLPHGIFMNQQNAFRSIVSSIKLSRFTLPTSSLFVLSVVLLSQGFNLLWSVPADTSWMMLVSILGHAFITTALLASSFIYYRDMNAWLQVVLEQVKAKATSAQA